MNRKHFTVEESTNGGQLCTATDAVFVSFLLFFVKSWGNYLNLKNLKYTFFKFRFRTISTFSKLNWNLAHKDLTVTGFFVNTL